MTLPTNIFTYAKWSGIATIICLVVAILSFIFSWGFRFRLVGVTSFMGVLTTGIFALGLSLFPHAEIPGAARYSLVYDNGFNQAVIAVAPDIEKSAIEPTLLQAARDLYSYGRTGSGTNSEFTVKLRTILHPTTGISQPLYLGEAKRSLINRSEEDIRIELLAQNWTQLPASAEVESE